MKKLFSVSLFIFILFSTSCNTEIKDFKNIIEVTPEDCVKWSLPEIHFIISYPDNDQILVTKAEDGDFNSNYIAFDYITENGLCNEELSVGYCKNCSNFSAEEQIKSMNELSTQFEEQLPNYKLVSIKSEKFWGKERVVAKFTFESDETIFDYFESGKYIGIIGLKEGKEEHGVIFIMLGNENSGISNYDEFGKKGKLSGIFKTFRFVE